MFTRRQFLKMLASLPFLHWCEWLDAIVGDGGPADRLWVFDGEGLAFPAYFLTGRQLSDLARPYRLHLPLIRGG